MYENFKILRILSNKNFVLKLLKSNYLLIYTNKLRIIRIYILKI